MSEIFAEVNFWRGVLIGAVAVVVIMVGKSLVAIIEAEWRRL